MFVSHLNFSYVIAGVLAGMAQPGRAAPLKEDLALLARQGIRAIVSLTEEPINEVTVGAQGFRYLHLPVEDFTAPSLEQINAGIAFIDRMRAAGNPVAVHCYAGLGRTGAMLACYLVKDGLAAASAIERVRRSRPDSVQTDGQIRQVFRYEEKLRNL